MRLTGKTIALITGAVAVAIAIAVLLVAADPFGDRVVPGLDKQMDAVARVEIVRGGNTLKFDKAEDGSWVADSLGDAPARPGTVEDLLDKLAGMAPADDPQPGNTNTMPDDAVTVTLKDAKGAVLNELTLGRPADAKGGAGLVRLGAKGQVVAAQDVPQISFDPAVWTEPALPGLGERQVRNFKVIFPDGRLANYTRAKPGEAFQQGEGNSAPPIDGQAIAQVAEALRSWSSVKVQSAKDMAWTGAPMVMAEAFDGLVMTMMPVADKAGTWVRVNAHFAAPANADPATAKAAQEEAERLNSMRAFAFLLPPEQAKVLSAVTGASVQQQ